MRKIFFYIVAGVFLLSSPCWAAFSDSDELNFSSFTKTADSQIAISSNTLRSGNVFVGVVVSSPANGSVTFYDAYIGSPGVAVSTIGVVNFMQGSNGGQTYTQFMVRLSSGLTYTISGTNPGITIIYKLSNPRL